MSELRRPRTIEEMAAVLKKFRTEEALHRGLGIAVRPTDVFISTYPKSGTTWLQHVVHGLRSGGSLAFDEISEVVPWLETAFDMDIDPDADQVCEPRVFKAHLEWERIPKGGRCITSFRDPRSVLLSFYSFFEGWFFEPGAIEVDEFARRWFLAGTASGTYWDHIVSWTEMTGRDDVLVLCYEDMVKAPDDVPALIADFLKLDVSEAVLEKVVTQSSREFMATNASKFDDHQLRDMRAGIWGLPAGGSSKKVQSASHAKPVLSSEIEAELNAVWAREIEATLGFPTYDAFRASLPNPLDVDRES